VVEAPRTLEADEDSAATPRLGVALEEEDSIRVSSAAVASEGDAAEEEEELVAPLKNALVAEEAEADTGSFSDFFLVFLVDDDEDDDEDEVLPLPPSRGKRTKGGTSVIPAAAQASSFTRQFLPSLVQ
jgi:hypothetical protein